MKEQMIREITFKDGSRAQRALKPHDLRGRTYDQIIRSAFDPGWSRDRRPHYTFILRRGTKVDVLSGSSDIHDYHKLCLALLQLLPPGRGIDTV